mmetsp:Transcript_21478/g.30086  ORF Transcript_21478/g.30086 Transcript_21478/m.30086 type:complete len:113 (-) Transcript_21478:946-1284(-)
MFCAPSKHLYWPSTLLIHHMFSSHRVIIPALKEDDTGEEVGQLTSPTLLASPRPDKGGVWMVLHQCSRWEQAVDSNSKSHPSSSLEMENYTTPLSAGAVDSPCLVAALSPDY